MEHERISLLLGESAAAASELAALGDLGAFDLLPRATPDLLLARAVRPARGRARPAGRRPAVDPDGRSATWLAERGGRLRYEGLAARDAEGIDLPASMEAAPGGLRLVVETTGAVGPVTIDPVVAGSPWSASIGGGFTGAALTSSQRRRRPPADGPRRTRAADGRGRSVRL